MANAGFDLGGEGAPPPPQGEPSAEDIANSARFFDHELYGTVRYVPDATALKAARVIVGIGAASGGLVTYRTSVALGELLGRRRWSSPATMAASWGSRRSSRTRY